ncbi:MAG: uracil phosphoribosyltransferase [Mycoplasmataceae bacterium]|nr:uracil phosphoribosyltransferase [Mycoplasmataceae bacterium]
MLHVLNHPLIKICLSKMRNKNTDSRDFRARLKELSMLMCYEVAKDYPVVDIKVQTPVGVAVGHKLKTDVVLVAILRAGLGMIDGFTTIIPSAATGFVGLYRDEKTLKPVEYYTKMPDSIKNSNVIILDPMLATGHSAEDAVTIIKTYKPKSIKFACVVSAPEGIKVVQKAHPKLDIYTCVIDKKLNSQGYIVPGLGDAGDRIFKTK